MQTRLLIALMVLSSFTILIVPKISSEPAKSDADQLVVTISITQDAQSACVEPPEERRMYFSGIINVQALKIPLNHDLIVDLSYDARSDRREWFAEGTEQLFFNRGDSTKDFYCAVDVPDSTFVGDTGTLTVTGIWRITPNGGTGEAIPDTARIDILPYSYPYLEAFDEIIVADPGEEVEFRLSLWNWGNGPDDITISCIGTEDITILDFPTEAVHLDIGGVYRFTFKARADTSGEKEIQIVAKGLHEGNFTPENITLALAIEDGRVDDPFGHTSFASFLIVTLSIIAIVGIGLSFWLIRRDRWRSYRGSEGRSGR